MFKFVFLTLFAITEVQSQTLDDDQSRYPISCLTPNNDVGICIEVKKCTIFVNALTSGKSDSFDFIRESRCGADNEYQRQPKVCCGMYDNYLEQKSASPARGSKRINNTPSKSPFPENCGVQDIGIRVLGGTEAELGQFPWMARLRRRRSDGSFLYACSGFLISKQFVLTAAHCIRSKQLNAFGPVYQVQLGEHNIQTDPDCETPTFCADPPQLLRTAEPIVHPEYTGDVHKHHDIAIIPLLQHAKFTDYVQPICLSKTLSQEPYLWVSGWGKTETGDSSNVKLNVMIPRSDMRLSTYLYKNLGITIADSQFCAGGVQGRDSCTGDSGGPVMVDRVEQPNGERFAWSAEGIVSFGKGCGLAGWPGVYTSIPSYMPWIESTINQYIRDNGEEEEEVANEEDKTELIGSCTTPNGERAHCISLYDCTVLYEVLTGRPNPEAVRFLQESQCGFHDKVPQVCCGQIGGYITLTNRGRGEV